MRERDRSGKRRLRWRVSWGLIRARLVNCWIFGERKAERKSAKVDEVFARYLKLVEQVTAAVDKMLDPAAIRVAWLLHLRLIFYSGE